MAPPQKKPTRTRLTLKEKLELIDNYRTLGVDGAVKKYNVCASAVYKIMKTKDELKQQYYSNQNQKTKQKQKECSHDKVNKAVYEWFCQARAKNLPISGTIIQKAALDIAALPSINDTEFKASNGWLQRFKERHTLSFGAICGESADVEESSVTEWKSKLAGITAGYAPKDIANCDESALFFRAIPQKTMMLKGEKCHGGKLSKERLAVLLCAFADGSIEKPLIIGRAENPRCFKTIKKSDLPVIWKSNRKAWMTTPIMEEWLIHLNRKMAIQKRKILLFMDNASSHPMLKLSNVEIVFLPPRTTSHLQPLDQGIIRSFKVFYRQRVLSRLISQMETIDNVSQLCEKINVLNAVYWTAGATKQISENCVKNCFRHAGFTLNESNEIEEDSDEIALSELIRRIDPGCTNNSLNEFIAIDDGVFTETDEISIANLTSAAIVNEDSDEENEPDSQVNIAPQEALRQLIALSDYAASSGNEQLFAKINECIRLQESDIINKKSKQTVLTDFFVNK